MNNNKLGFKDYYKMSSNEGKGLMIAGVVLAALTIIGLIIAIVALVNSKKKNNDVNVNLVDNRQPELKK